MLTLLAGTATLDMARLTLGGSCASRAWAGMQSRQAITALNKHETLIIGDNDAEAELNGRQSLAAGCATRHVAVC